MVIAAIATAMSVRLQKVLMGFHEYTYRANYNSFDLICQMTGQQSVWTDIERK